MEHTFTAREHLEALVVATKNVYASSEDPSHLMVAGVFEACLVRMDFLYNQVENLTSAKEGLVRLLKEAYEENSKLKKKLADAENAPAPKAKIFSISDKVKIINGDSTFKGRIGVIAHIIPTDSIDNEINIGVTFKNNGDVVYFFNQSEIAHVS